ncbi:GNAT family N-acetyltransferase [Rhizohabitans arisaemae]|uniref:GNAT family N-acetyltransferase n=1 Tax=Rhizohabitans arisaemae TaxID=2720610 RepID=UPI0024B0D26A|nr:GNAT family N-acetyltransferase [Rhizohabitans arisaemae]
MTDLEAFTEAVRDRHAEIDPLLPGPAELPEGEPLIVAGAVGVPRRIRLAADSVDLAWGAEDQFRLPHLVAGPEPARALDRLLGAWREHIARCAPGEDSAATLTWPSRDVEAVPALLRRGFQPHAVASVRLRGWPGPRYRARNVVVRTACPGDLDAVVALWHAEIRYDAFFGQVGERRGIARRLRAEMAQALAVPDPWVWLAELDGAPAALAYVQDPTWTGPMVRAEPTAYLTCMSVAPSLRGRGVGAALAGHVHRRLDAVGVEATLLHYCVANPVSGTFWARMGYRALWTSWQVSPATAIRPVSAAAASS